MKNYDLNTVITACDLEDVLKAGSNITITKIDSCTLEISSTGGGLSNGIKYHFKDGDETIIEECIQYNLYYNLILDINSKFTIDSGGQLIVHNGFINNCGQLVNNGQILNV